MFTQFRFLFISAVLFLTIPLGLQANPPIRDEWSGYFESVPLLDCGDYWIMSNELVGLSWIYFFDRDGNFIREIFMIDVVDDLYREGKPIHVPGHANVIVQAHYEDGEWLWEQRQGVFYRVNVPGYGDLMVQVGRIMRDEDGFFFETPHAEFEYGPLCDYLRQE